MPLFRRENPQWRLDHELLYVNISTRTLIAGLSAPREVKAALSAVVHAAHSAISEFADRVRQALVEDDAVERFVTVISEKESGSMIRAHLVVAHCYAQEMPTRCHLEALWEPSFRTVAAQVFGEPGYAPDPSSTDVLFYAMTAAQVPVTSPLSAEALGIWAEVYGEGWAKIERGLEDTSPEEFDPDPTALNEVAPLWIEYKRMRSRGEISDG
jgi:hypothetical protein